MSEIEEPDRLLDFPHPRETTQFVGHEAQLKSLLAALQSQRFPHGWIFAGPAGIGKATLAYRLARFILKYPPGSSFSGTLNLDIPTNDLIFQQIAAQSHPSLKVIKRPYDHKRKRLKTEITVDAVRELHDLVQNTAADGGWRVALIDCADEMNISAANALLKMLEEPPKNTVLILISHQSGRLLATLRSRCRILNFNVLDQQHVTQLLAELCGPEQEMTPGELETIARLANGSIGHALQLATGGGLKAYEKLLNLLEGLPKLDSAAAHELAEQLSRHNAGEEFQFFCRLLCQWLNIFVRFCTTGEDNELPEREYNLCQRLSAGVDLEPWLEVWEKSQTSILRAQALNLDKRQLLLNIFFQLESAAKQAQKSQ